MWSATRTRSLLAVIHVHSTQGATRDHCPGNWRMQDYRTQLEHIDFCKYYKQLSLWNTNICQILGEALTYLITRWQHLCTATTPTFVHAIGWQCRHVKSRRKTLFPRLPYHFLCIHYHHRYRYLCLHCFRHYTWYVFTTFMFTLHLVHVPITMVTQH